MSWQSIFIKWIQLNFPVTVWKKHHLFRSTPECHTSTGCLRGCGSMVFARWSIWISMSLPLLEKRLMYFLIGKLQDLLKFWAPDFQLLFNKKQVMSDNDLSAYEQCKVLINYFVSLCWYWYKTDVDFVLQQRDRTCFPSDTEYDEVKHSYSALDDNS